GPPPPVPTAPCRLDELWEVSPPLGPQCGPPGRSTLPRDTPPHTGGLYGGGVTNGSTFGTHQRAAVLARDNADAQRQVGITRARRDRVHEESRRRAHSGGSSHRQAQAGGEVT